MKRGPWGASTLYTAWNRWEQGSSLIVARCRETGPEVETHEVHEISGARVRGPGVDGAKNKV